MTKQELNERIQERIHQPLIKAGKLLVDRARLYAIQAHGDQRYGDEHGGNEPYIVHLDEVDEVLVEYDHIASVIRASGYLHDVLEDTHITLKQLNLDFPGYIPVIVEAVTAEPGKNRKERNSKTYPKIAKVPEAVVVKLADRIANSRHSKRTGDLKIPGRSLFEMYKKEYPDFRAALHDIARLETMRMWWELDRLFEYPGV